MDAQLQQDRKYLLKDIAQAPVFAVFLL